MKIVRVEAWPVHMKLVQPYAIAYETVESATNVFIRLVPDRGPVAYGCSAPDPGVTGETAESVLRALQGPIHEAIVGCDPMKRLELLERLQSPLAAQPAALAGIDLALHDLLGKRADLPLYLLLGGSKDEMVTSVTVGILDLDETVRVSADWVARGFRCLKLKGGLDAELDAERVARVRAAVGDAIELRFDANQGYNVAQALEFVHRTRPYRLELLEQPTPRQELAMLGSVAHQSSIPVMADESLVNLRDAFLLAREDLADMVNIKLMKVGGLHQALHINSVARAADLEVMIGCMDESGLAIAAGLHFALARSNVHYADLDGHFDLQGDPARDAVILESGRLRPTGKPGLGFNLDE